ncbi:hypothetical protein ACI2UK_25725 [Ralstonia nicotianae]|uniref:hypothetical protein n=1 Tax=Ralstonia pseudosolanacearum TaxID=1310165 RepID=UPI002002A84B|nr:hypothetical protein [Ralstonia pseudosolanacearum]MCK4120651.1 hypothetical protein [Ralstonia pseudosolanacearum]
MDRTRSDINLFALAAPALSAGCLLGGCLATTSEPQPPATSKWGALQDPVAGVVGPVAPTSPPIKPPDDRTKINNPPQTILKGTKVNTPLLRQQQIEKQ